MTVRIYTWTSGVTNTFCDDCADHVINDLVKVIVKENPGLSEDQYEHLNLFQKIDLAEETAVFTIDDCELCLSEFNSYLQTSNSSQQTTF